MGSFYCELGKGLREPCSPFRAVNVYGAPLNSPNAGGYNCPPVVVGPTTTFDLSKIAASTEVCVVLALIQGANGGTYRVTFRWFRGAELAPFYQFSFGHTPPVGGWMYGYSYTGYVPWEISGPGEYAVDVTVEGAESFYRTIRFNATGAVTLPSPPTPVGAGLRGLADGFAAVSTFFLNLYVEVLDWVWPFYLLGPPFYGLFAMFGNMSQVTAEFATTMDGIILQVAGMLTWESVVGLIRDWWPGLDSLVSWFTGWWDQVLGVIAGWWSGVETTVRGWIDVATQGFTELRAAWDNFWVVILPGLIDWSVLTSWWNSRYADVELLVNQKAIEWAPFWAGWQDIRTTVLEFFADPLEWLWGRFTDWFLGAD